MNILDRHLLPNNNPETSPLFLQLLRASQIQQSLLINTLVSSQQKAFSSLLQQSFEKQPEEKNTDCFQTNSIAQFNSQLQKLFNQSLTGSSVENTPVSDLPTLKQSTNQSNTTHSLKKPDVSKKCLSKFKTSLNNRPRAHTTPNTLNVCHKMRPKTQSFNSTKRTVFKHHPSNFPKRNSDSRVLEELAAVYLMKSLEPITKSTQPPTIKQQNLPINVLHQILDDVLETSHI